VAGHEGARNNIGIIEAESRNIERAFKHWIIAASAGEYHAMNRLRSFFEKGLVSRETIDSTLAAYNNSSAEIRSEARDACIQIMISSFQDRYEILLRLLRLDANSTRILV
jgi:TPR repeat protein